MRDCDFDKAVDAVVKAASSLMREGVIGCDEEGFYLTPYGKALVAVKERYKLNKTLTSMREGYRLKGGLE